MKRYTLLLIAVLVVATAACQPPSPASLPKIAQPREVIGSSLRGEEKKEIKNIHGVSLETFGELYIEMSDTEGFSISGDDNVLPYYEAVVDNGILRIREVAGADVLPSKPVQFTVQVINLDRIDLPSSGIVHFSTPIETPSLSLKSSDSGEINLEDLKTEKLNVELSGSGTITVAGNATMQKILLSGSGKFKGENLDSQTVEATLTDDSEAQLKVNNTLNANLSGNGKIQYRGEAKVTRSVSGAGNIEQLKP
jgi:hypothetical protein